MVVRWQANLVVFDATGEMVFSRASYHCCFRIQQTDAAKASVFKSVLIRLQW